MMFESDFNYDFRVTLDETIAPLAYNFRNQEDFEDSPPGWPQKPTYG